MTKSVVKRRAKQRGDENKKAVRVLSVEVARIGHSKEEDKAARDRLKELCEMVQQATNYVWAEWFSWHHANCSAAKIREYLDCLTKWRNAEIEEKPQLKLHDLTKIDKNTSEKKPQDQCMPNVLSNAIYAGVTAQWPDLHSRVVVLLNNRLMSLIKSKKSANGNLSGWMSVLLYREQIPSSIHPLPLPFDTPKTASSSNGNAILLLPETDDGSHRLIVSFAREAIKGKKTKQSVKFDCTIWDKGRSMASRRNTLKKIATGEYQMLGSHLCFKRGKVFADIAYEMPQSPQKELTGTAVIIPSANRPLIMRVIGSNRNQWLGGDGRHVKEVRRQLMGQRLGRKSCHRWSPTSNNKGHGRERSNHKFTKLSRRWNDFVNTVNNQLAAQLVAKCIADGVGTVIVGKLKKATRFLANAGNNSRFDSTSWDWYGLEKRIQDKCNASGIKCVVREKTNAA